VCLWCSLLLDEAEAGADGFGVGVVSAAKVRAVRPKTAVNRRAMCSHSNFISLGISLIFSTFRR
jgi:hypothetical protein